MKKFIVSMASTVLLLLSANANAFMLNFLEMADGAYGESAWDQMVFSDLDGIVGLDLVITGYNSNGAAYAYMDSKEAGLGVCGGLHDVNTANTMYANSTSNLCNPSSDDNVTTGEFLVFKFMFEGEEAEVSGFTITANDNHDAKTMDGHTLKMNGTTWNTSGTTDTYQFGKNHTFVVAHSVGKFYVESLSIERGGLILRVPEPSNLVLMALAIIGLVISRKKLA